MTGPQFLDGVAGKEGVTFFTSPSNLFCLDLKITIPGFFFTLSEILFAFNQLTECFKSALISFFHFFIELLKHNRLMS